MLCKRVLTSTLLLSTAYFKSNTSFYGVAAEATNCAAWCGDPHFHTFDKLGYDCQGAGEFDVLKDLDSNFNIRGRFQHLDGRTNGVTVTRGVAFNHIDNGKTVSLTLRDEVGPGTCYSKVRVDGNEVVDDEISNYLDKKDDNTYEVETDDGATLKIVSRNAGKFGCFYCIRVCVPDETKENIVGLLGSPNGDIYDDWMDKNGNQLVDENGNPSPAPVGDQMKLRFEEAYDYCRNNWCITDENESMFTYPLEYTVHFKRNYKSESFEIMNIRGGGKLLHEQLPTPRKKNEGKFELLSNEPVPPGVTGPIIQYKKDSIQRKSWQWLGWDEEFVNKSHYITVSLWIKFVGEVPPRSWNFGLKIHGNINNEWVDDMVPNKWKFVSACAQNTHGDLGHSILIFDTVDVENFTVLIADMKLEVRDTCTPNRNFDYYNKCPVPFDTTTKENFENADEAIKELCQNDVGCIIEAVEGGTEEAEVFLDAKEELVNEHYSGGATKTLSPTDSGNSADSVDGENSGGGVKGDPHFKTWDGQPYDFHGICDLVLLHNPDFMNGVGMDIHIRSTKTRQWSYISRAVVKIGNETFELATHNGRKNISVEYFINGISGKDETPLEDNMNLPNKISGYEIQHLSLNSQQKAYIINLGDGEIVGLYTWKHMIRIDLKGCKAKNFASSVGLMGTFAHSLKVGRDNSTTFENLNEFGQEWQVLASEGNLFQTVEGPQAPAKCEIPSKMQLRRRLSQSEVTMEEAELACARVTNKDDFNLCVFDVIATNDTGSVGAY